MGRFPQAAIPLRIAEQAWILSGERTNIGDLRIVQALRSAVQGTMHAVDYATEAFELLADDRTGGQAVAGVVLAKAYLSEGKIAEAEKTNSIVRATVDVEPRDWVRLAEMNASADVLAQQGKLLEAAVLYRRVVKRADERQVMQAQIAHGALGDVCIEWNMIDEGVRNLRQAEALAEQTQVATNRHIVSLALARAYWAWGDIEAAFDEIERGVEFANQMEFPQAIRDARACQAHFWLLQGRVALAHRWADSNDLDPFLPPAYERQREYLTFARLLIADERPELALTVLQANAELAEAQGRVADVLQISLLKAL